MKKELSSCVCVCVGGGDVCGGGGVVVVVSVCVQGEKSEINSGCVSITFTDCPLCLF